MTMHSEQASAFRQSWRENNMRELMIALIEEYPHADQKEITRRFIELARTSDEHLWAAVDHAVNNTFRALKNATKSTPQQRAEVRSERDATVADLKQRLTEFVFLEMILPVCGKPLKEATFAEVRKEGGLLAKIGTMGKPSQIVGQVLTEKQLQKLWKPAA